MCYLLIKHFVLNIHYSDRSYIVMKIRTQKILLFTVIFSFASFYMYAQKKDYGAWKKNFDKGVALIDSSKHKNALPHLETAYKIAQKTFTQKDKELEATSYQLGKIYAQNSEYEKTAPLYLESLECLKFNGKESDSIYGARLSQLGVVYRNMGKYEKASKALLNSLEIIEKHLGIQNLEYASTLLELSIVYKKKGEFTKAINTNLESNEIIKKLCGEESKQYATNLTLLSQIYSETGNYDIAIPVQKKVIASYTEEDKNSMSYVQSIYTMALLYHEINEYEKEISIYEEVIEILGEDHQGSISAFNNIGQAYDHLGNYEKALFYTKKSISNTSETHPELPTRLQNLAFIYVTLGNYEKALANYNKALIARKNISGTDHYLYGRIINNIGKLYDQKGDINQAVKLYKEALDNLLKNFDENHFNYGYYLNDYASALLKKGENEKAISLFKKNISIFEKNSRSEVEDYYKAKFYLAQAYNNIGDYSNALPLLKNASKKIKNILGANHILYGRILESLSDSYFGLEKIDKAISTIELSNSIVIGQLDKIFKFRSEKEKKAFLNTMVNNFDHMQSIAYTNNLKFEKLNDINLSNQLMLKGLLLNNSKDNLVQLSTLNDSIVDQKILSYRTLKRDLSKQLSLPIADRAENMDSLKNIINTREAELVKMYSTHFGESIHLVKDWKSSQSNLKDDEIAIEYSSFRLTNKGKQTDSVMYVAYLYKNDWQHPKMVSLFEEKQLKKILNNNQSPNTLYRTDELYDLIWKPLEKHIGNTKTIYYSPSSLLNQISYAAIKKENSLINKYNLTHISSTAILEKKPTEPSLASTLFIGGIDYDYNETLNKEIKNSNQNAYLNNESIKKSRGTKTRGETWDELPGTLLEINSLQNILKSNGYDYNMLTKAEATEANFKKFSGNSPSILHIATHGFFYENKKNKSQINMNLSTEDQYRLAEDPLLRSGLILAGANYAWKNGVNPNEDEDGILTAMEISNLDLSNTDMVVLSACETGLGDIDGSEGVYGLQRAFKMAGVDIIVMSLWKVPDIKTAEFMNLFYSNWMITKNIRKAFNLTQRKMQKKYKNEPLIWAAFVLFE